MSKRLKGALIVLGTLGALAASSTVYAQQTYRSSCFNVGSSTPEPFGDREGHATSLGQIACRIEGGPLEGGVLTGYSAYEWKGLTGDIYNGFGVIRKPGSMTTYTITEGKTTLVVTDGKVSGLVGSGKGKYLVAVGGASSLAGKTFDYALKSTGPGQFYIDVKIID